MISATHRRLLFWVTLMVAALLFGHSSAAADEATPQPDEPVLDLSATSAEATRTPQAPTIQAQPQSTTSQDPPGKSCSTIDFEGLGNRSEIPEFDGITSPGWLALIDEDAGGTGNFAFEPSPSTIAFWLGEPEESRDIIFAKPVSDVSLFYASFPDVRLDAFDADGNLVDSATGLGNFNQGPGGDPNGEFNQWDPLGVSTDENLIEKVTFSGNVNQSGIDDLRVCRSVRIHSVEFTQAIQEWQTLEELTADLEADGAPPVAIVALKSVALRVYMEEVDTVTEVQVQISGVASGDKNLVLQPGCTPERARLQDGNCQSANFYFGPPSGDWSVTVKTSVEDVELQTLAFDLSSVRTTRLDIFPVRVCDAIEPESEQWLCGTRNQLRELLPFLRSTFPGTVGLFVSTGEVKRETDTADFTDWWLPLLADIRALWTEAGSPESRYYYGMVRASAGTGGGVGGAGYTPGHAAASRASITRGDLGGSQVETADEVVAHELGHNAGRRHAPSPASEGCYNQPGDLDDDWPYGSSPFIQQVGFDIARGKALAPTEHTDWLTYCTPRWISPYTASALIEVFSTNEASTQSFAPLVSGEFWLISGTLEGSAAVLAPTFQLETAGSLGEGSGDYRIELSDADGNVLATRRFDPVRAHAEDLESPPGFAELIVVNASATRLRIVDPDDTELATVALEGVPPTVGVTFPAGGETLEGWQTVRWEVQDADSQDHTFWVQYSADGGVTWATLSPSVDEPRLLVDFDQLPGSAGSAAVKVIASDGINSGTSISQAFTVPKQPPSAELNFPSEHAIYQAAQLVWLQGAGFDADDGELTGEALVWVSDLDGHLGSGQELPTTALSEGLHTITLTATDSDGNTASDATRLQIDGVRPTLSLSVLPDGTPASCVIVDIDAEDNSAGSGLAAVEYSLDAGESWIPIELQELPFDFVVPGTGFFHFITRAVDLAGNLSALDDKFFIENECTEADLAVSKLDDPDPVVLDHDLTYVVEVTNHGPLEATEVVLTDELPEHAEFVSASPSQGECTASEGGVTCELGSIGRSATAEVTLVVRPTRPRIITNRATVASAETDPNGSDNSASQQTQVDVAIDIWPFLRRNPIFLNRDHPVPVAILSGAQFDAPGEVVIDGLTFGRTGAEDSLDRCLERAVDVNHDDHPDRICIFSSGDAGFKPGDTKGVLRGTLLDGTPIEGRDSVTIVSPMDLRAFRASLEGEQEVPPVDSAARGAAVVLLNRSGTRLHYVINVRPLPGVTAIHIHCGPEGENGPIGATLYGGPPRTRVAYSGSISAPDADNSCGWADLDTLTAALRSGETYINIHTVRHTEGEVRGQLRPVASLWN